MAEDVTLRGKIISQDEYGFLSLTDMWRLSQESESKSPPFWRRLPTTKELNQALFSNLRFSQVLDKTPEKSTMYTRRGSRGGTFAHALEKLKATQAILDHMGFYELAANMYRTALAQQYLTLHQVESVPRACHVHRRMGQRVRTDHEELGLTMPEDMPVVPSIKEAQKRLKALEKEKGKGKQLHSK